MTMLEKFKAMHPNAPLCEDGTPKWCPDSLGWVYTDCDGTLDCCKCWNREYSPAMDEKRCGGNG